MIIKRLLPLDWGFRELSQWLNDLDIAHLAVCALENEWSLEVVDFFLYEDYGRLQLTPLRLRDRAAVNGCWRALAQLVRFECMEESPPVRGPLTVDGIITSMTETLGRRVHSESALRWLLQYRAVAFPMHLLWEAARLGNLEALLFLRHTVSFNLTRRCFDNGFLGALLNHAIKGKSVQVVDWVLSLWPNRVVRLKDNMFGCVAWCNQGEWRCFSERWGLRLAWRSNCGTFPFMDLAADDGDLDLMKAIRRHPLGRRACSWRAVSEAASIGRADILEWLNEHQPQVEWQEEALVEAVINGHLEWLRSHRRLRGKPWMFEMLFGNNQVREMIAWLRLEFRDEYDECIQELFECAAHLGFLDVVRDFCATEVVHVDSSFLSRIVRFARSHPECEPVLQFLLSTYPHVPAEQDHTLHQALANGNFDQAALLLPIEELSEVWSWSPYHTSVKMLEKVYDIAQEHGFTIPRIPTSRMLHFVKVNRRIIKWASSMGLVGPYDPNVEQVEASRTLHSTDEHCWDGDLLCGRSGIAKTYDSYDWARTSRCVHVNMKWTGCVIAAPVTAKYCPHAILSWHSLDVLKEVTRYHGDLLFTRDSMLLLLGHSRNADIMQWFLTQAPWLYSMEVCSWAVRFRMERLLGFVFDKFVLVPVRHPSFIAAYRCRGGGGCQVWRSGDSGMAGRSHTNKLFER